jgi:hypothetical protein
LCPFDAEPFYGDGYSTLAAVWHYLAGNFGATELSLLLGPTASDLANANIRLRQFRGYR